jgi:hypothetical protein
MAHTKYVAEHIANKGPGVFHLATCAEAKALERLPERARVVHSGAPEAERALPNLGYSDYRAALVEQGFTPCAACKP